MKKGLIHIYTGEGKGKTTAALGLGMRAAGRGFKVVMIQFLKSAPSGETEFLIRTSKTFEIVRFQRQSGFYPDMTPQQKLNTALESMQGFKFAKECLKNGKYDLVILDEILGAIHLGIISLDDVTDAVQNKDDATELVITGRDAPDALISMADYVTEMKLIKHPYDNGTPARHGIEF